MATTAKGIPYPVGADNNNSAASFLDLANWLDAYFTGKTTAQIDALTGAALWAGRQVFNTDTKQMEFYDGVRWNVLGVPVGTVIWLANTSTIRGYSLAEGAAVSRTTFATLYALLGTLHGVGDGSTTFNLPNLAGRAIWGLDAGQTEFNVVGKKSGSKTVTLVTANLPSHQHDTPIHSHPIPSHDHVMTHDHAYSFGFSGSHQHLFNAQSVPAQTGSGSAQGVNLLNGVSASFNFLTATSPGGDHVHSFDITPFTGSTAGSGILTTNNVGFVTNATGSDAPFAMLPPYIVLRAYIKT
jgi:microcystin-dependent protein